MNETAHDPEWVTRARARELLGLGRAQVDNLRRVGKLESRRNPHTGRVSIRLSSVQELLRLRTPGTGDRGSE